MFEILFEMFVFWSEFSEPLIKTSREMQIVYVKTEKKTHIKQNYILVKNWKSKLNNYENFFIKIEIDY